MSNLGDLKTGMNLGGTTVGRTEQSGNKDYETKLSHLKSQHSIICDLVNSISLSSTCDKKHVGCVMVDDNYNILSWATNHPDVGAPFCRDEGHLIQNGHCVRNLHGEQNAICKAANRGISLKGAICYVNWKPCRPCAMMLINCGVKEVRVEEKRVHKADEILNSSDRITMKYWDEVE